MHIQGLPQVTLDNATLASALGAVFMIIGALATLFIIIGAIQYAISAGEQSKITQAKNTIMYAVVGLIISLSAFAIVQFVLGRLNS